TRRVTNQLGELDDGRLHTGADVERARIEGAGGWQGSRCGKEVGVGDVGYVDVIAGLHAVAEDGQLASCQHSLAEDRDDAGLAVGVLARAVDVAVAEGDRVETVH